VTVCSLIGVERAKAASRESGGTGAARHTEERILNTVFAGEAN